MEQENNSKTVNLRVYQMPFAKVYPLLVNKVERKGRQGELVAEVIQWLTGYSKCGLEQQIKEGVTLEQFFANAPCMNPNAKLITGTICGRKVQDIQDPLMQKIRWMDKLADELAQGKSLDEIKRRN